MMDSNPPRGAPPARAAPPGAAEHEPELSRLERKVLEAYAAPSPPHGAADAVLAALFAPPDSEREGDGPSRRRTDGLAPRR
jgi:hypothetical protein